jgi:hypothetical protein
MSYIYLEHLNLNDIQQGSVSDILTILMKVVKHLDTNRTYYETNIQDLQSAVRVELHTFKVRYQPTEIGFVKYDTHTILKVLSDVNSSFNVQRNFYTYEMYSLRDELISNEEVVCYYDCYHFLVNFYVIKCLEILQNQRRLFETVAAVNRY